MKILLTTLSTLILTHTSVYAAEVNQQALKKEAIGIVKQFGGTLKPQLGKAMKTQGPVAAIKMCSETAPKIAKDLSAKTGWDVRRVSLKARNTSATPDAWETKVLKQFDQRQAAGESAKKMAYAEVVNGQFRFMKAQGVEPVCLTCHASKIAAPIESTLKDLYPHDKARGYTLGQIRGAFSLTKDL